MAHVLQCQEMLRQGSSYRCKQCLRQAIHTMLSLRPYGSNGQISAPSFSNLHGSGACTREMWQTSSPSGRDNPHLPGETCFSFWKSTKCCRSRLHMSAALAKEWVFPSTMPPACWHAISWSWCKAPNSHSSARPTVIEGATTSWKKGCKMLANSGALSGLQMKVETNSASSKVSKRWWRSRCKM